MGSKPLKAVKRGQQTTLVETHQKGTLETESSHTSEEIPQESAKKGKSSKESKPIPIDSLNVLSPIRLDFQGFENEGLDVQKYFQSAQLMPLQTLEACFVVAHVKEFYKNLRSLDDNLITEVCGNIICFNSRLLAQLLGLPYEKTFNLPCESAEFYLKSALGKDCLYL